ncbi:Serine/threonine-protein kinase [Ascosphaera acerosa]|nr:Serine/threonine-protein kinase [Ascosphaera acerosa]
MGQGYSLTSMSAASAGIDIPELSDLVYERSLGASRLIKAIRARHHDGVVVVKVIMKLYADMDMGPYIRAFIRERDILADIPNTLGYHRIVETANAGYLARQYMHSSLYDRLSTRPFLETIEKKWITFQLLCALRDCHQRDVFHGDIKTENVLVTSWNWIYLADFSSSFKPTFLPEDNPADFSFYFDTSGRRTCYLAPERFLGPGRNGGSRGVDWAMDIFSAGCVVAELFLETPIFTLSQLFRYRKGEYDPESDILPRLEDPDLRDLVRHMIRLEPEARYSADECLRFWRHKLFPDYFCSFLHQYMSFINTSGMQRYQMDRGDETWQAPEADERIVQVHHDFDKISYFLGLTPWDADSLRQQPPSAALTTHPLPLHLDLPSPTSVAGRRRPASDDGSLIFLTLVTSSLRSTLKASTRLKACDILLAFSRRVTDEAKMDRVLPYIVWLLSDPCDSVKVTAIKALAQLLSSVKVISPMNSCVVPDYISPRLAPFVSGSGHKTSAIVRTTYASCIACLAEASLRLLDVVQTARPDAASRRASIATEPDCLWKDDIYRHHDLYDTSRVELVQLFESHTKSLITDNDVVVRRALLSSVPSLCVCFGSPKTSEVILSHLNTYLNDEDWMLKCAFFEVVVGVAVHVGSYSLREFILPLMIQSLTDPEEFVVERVLRALSSLGSLGLLHPSTTWALMKIVVRFVVHPNVWIRDAAASYIRVAMKLASPADKYAIMMPMIRPFLRVDSLTTNDTAIIDNLTASLPRNVWEMAITWASKAQRTRFWSTLAAENTFAFMPHRESLSSDTRSLRDLKAMHKTLTEEDTSWLQRLRGVGLRPEDEYKLVALGEYLWRTVKRAPAKKKASPIPAFYPMINLNQHGITPQTVFFENAPPPAPRQSTRETGRRRQVSGVRTHTLVDALLDASTSIASSSLERQNSALSLSEQRLQVLAAEQATSARKPAAEDNDKAVAPATRICSPQFGAKDGHQDDRHRHPADARKSTPIQLLDGKLVFKTSAGISTTQTNATGSLNPLKSPDPYRPSPLSITDSPEDTPEDAARPRHRSYHTYRGTDPTVLKLLDAVHSGGRSSKRDRFGPTLRSGNPDGAYKRVNAQPVTKTWRPQGTLVALLAEHTGAINRIAVAPDHRFFLTASDDGTVRVWDAARLEINLTPRSRLTHRHATGARVTSLTFVTDTHTFISAATDGSIHVVRVHCHVSSGTTTFAKLEVLARYEISDDSSRFCDEHAVWLEHVNGPNASLLLFATNKSRIVAMDLDSMKPIYDLTNPTNHGMITTFCIDKRHNWLLLGTAHGILDLWDLRFQIRIRSWGINGGTPIHRLHVYPLRGMGRWVCVVGGSTNGSEVMVWDIDKLECREVYRVALPTGGTTGESGREQSATPRRHHTVDMAWKRYEACKLDDDPVEIVSRLAADSPRSTGSHARVDHLVEPQRNVMKNRNGICALAIGHETIKVGEQSYKGAFLISGGSDRRLRYWDVSYPEYSGVIGEGLSGSASQLDMDVTTPIPQLRIATDQSVMPDQASSRDRRTHKRAASSDNPSSRSTPIIARQQHLLERHLDVITDVAILQEPYAMVLSANRGGMVYVFR